MKRISRDSAKPFLRLWEGNVSGLVQKIRPADPGLESTIWKKELESYAPWEKMQANPEFKSAGWWVPGKNARGRGPMSVYLCGPCSSSLDVAWFFEERDLLNDFDSVIAMTQWSGRGQFRRKWHSEPGNLYLAWALPRVKDKLWEKIMSLVLGLVLVRVWEDLGVGLKIKWPNDLVLKGKKVGGILLEERKNRVLAGIGLNLFQAPGLDILQAGFGLQAGAFKGYCRYPGPVSLWLDLVHRASFCYLQMLGSEKPELILKQIERVLAFKNRQVWITASDGTAYLAHISGLGQDGGLLIYTQGSKQVVYSGSIVPCEA